MSITLVEGNISAGKTTLVERLSNHLGYKAFFEPVENNPWLEKFYQDPKRYAFPLQMWILERRYQMYLEAMKYLKSHPGEGVLLDRSVFSDIVFARWNNELGQINDNQMTQYITKRHQLMTAVPLPDCVIYLDVAPSVCLHRMIKRNRGCEVGVSVEYLEGLDKHYKLFLNDMQRQGVPTINLDWRSFGTVDEVAERLSPTPPPVLQDVIVCAGK